MDKTKPESKTSATPFVRWPGSKRNLVPILRRSVPPDFTRYVEPFLGSECFFFALAPETAILADNNRLLISVYETVRDQPVMLANFLGAMGTSAGEYYAARGRLSRLSNRVERAKTFLYLNRLCFNGIYRTNREGQFNVPFGSWTGSMPSRAHLIACSLMLKRAMIATDDFEDTLSNARHGDFVYLDPPYFKTGRKTFGEYGYGCFDERDLERLIESATAASRRGARILISYSHNEEFLRAFKGWKVMHVRSSRNVAADPAMRHAETDLLMANYDLPRF